MGWETYGWLTAGAAVLVVLGWRLGVRMRNEEPGQTLVVITLLVWVVLSYVKTLRYGGGSVLVSLLVGKAVFDDVAAARGYTPSEWGRGSVTLGSDSWDGCDGDD